MACLSTLYTVDGTSNIPAGYFDDDNITFLQHKLTQLLRRWFKQSIIFDRRGIIRLMQRVLEERVDPIPKLNERVLMYAMNDFIVHQLDMDKHLRWEENYVHSQSLYDPTADIRRYDPSMVKMSNRLGFPRAGGSQRFYFT
jgi:hypothetical protein